MSGPEFLTTEPGTAIEISGKPHKGIGRLAYRVRHWYWGPLWGGKVYPVRKYVPKHGKVTNAPDV